MDSAENVYSLIDPVLQQWSKKHSYQLVKLYRDDPVRGFNIVSQRGDHIEIWIGPPKDGVLNLSVAIAPYRKVVEGTKAPIIQSRETLERSSVAVSELTTALDKALELANSWFATQIH